MAYKMSYSTLPTMTSNSIGGIVPDASSNDIDLLITLNPATGLYYVNPTQAVNNIFNKSLNPGAYIFTSSVFTSSTTQAVLQTELQLNGVDVSGGTTRVPARTGIPDGACVSNCSAFQVVTLSNLLFNINFPTLPNASAVSVYGNWSLMRIG